MNESCADFTHVRFTDVRTCTLYEDGEIDAVCQPSTSLFKECAVVAEEQAQG